MRSVATPEVGFGHAHPHGAVGLHRLGEPRPLAQQLVAAGVEGEHHVERGHQAALPHGAPHVAERGGEAGGLVQHGEHRVVGEAELARERSAGGAGIAGAVPPAAHGATMPRPQSTRATATTITTRSLRSPGWR